MSRQPLIASVILLATAALAILWHNIDIQPAALPPPADIGIDGLSAEQKFLIRGPVDINKAGFEDLVAIPRIGPSLAARILEFRSRHGKIISPEELLNVKGIGPKTLAIIVPYLKAGESKN